MRRGHYAALGFDLIRLHAMISCLMTAAAFLIPDPPDKARSTWDAISPIEANPSGDAEHARDRQIALHESESPSLRDRSSVRIMRGSSPRNFISSSLMGSSSRMVEYNGPLDPSLIRNSAIA